jgi:hypothetical protein
LLTDCFFTLTPKLFDLPEDIPRIEAPVDWAADFFQAYPELSTLGYQPYADKNLLVEKPILIPLDPEDPKQLANFVNGVKIGEPVHGRIELLHWSSTRYRALPNADWVVNIFINQFQEHLQQENPLGCYTKASLWLSSGEHRYKAHNDLVDGFLIHLSGKKQVRVWPIPESYRDETIFNLGDFEGRLKLEPEVFEMKPGQALFIPGGAMHDVVSDDTTVSVSFHMGSVYPILNLSKELNEILGREEISVPESMASMVKDSIYFFQPSLFFVRGKTATKGMPDVLSKALSGVLIRQTLDESELRDLLSKWWDQVIDQPTYFSPYPK